MGDTSEDCCATCTRWRRGYRQTTVPHEWRQSWFDGTLVKAGACRLAPAVWTGEDWEQSRMHQDDWCTEYQSIALHRVYL